MYNLDDYEEVTKRFYVSKFNSEKLFETASEARSFDRQSVSDEICSCVFEDHDALVNLFTVDDILKYCDKYSPVIFYSAIQNLQYVMDKEEIERF